MWWPVLAIDGGDQRLKMKEGRKKGKLVEEKRRGRRRKKGKLMEENSREESRIEEKKRRKKKAYEEEEIWVDFKEHGSGDTPLKKKRKKLERAPRIIMVDNYTLSHFLSPLGLRGFFQ